MKQSYVILLFLAMALFIIPSFAHAQMAPTVSLTTSSNIANSGQTTVFTAAAQGGTPPYTYNWVLPSGVISSTSDCIATTSTCTIAPIVTAQTWEVLSVTVTDSNSSTPLTSRPVAPVATTYFPIDPQPTVTLTASPSSIDIGQPTTLTITISTADSTLGITIPQIPGCKFTQGGTTVQFSGSRSQSCVITPTATGSVAYTAIVEYGGYATPVSPAPTTTVTVNPLPTVSLSQSANTANSSQPITFTVAPSGGHTAIHLFMDRLHINNSYMHDYTYSNIDTDRACISNNYRFSAAHIDGNGISNI
jgi:hypothetical protein